MPYSPTTWSEGVTTVGPTNMNHLEAGVANSPYGPDASANFVPVWNGSAWTYSGVKNAHVDAAAAIAYSKLNLATSIVNGDISTSAAIAYSKLSLAASIVNADVASAAAVAVSKLAAGTNGQVLTTTAGVPTWAAATGAATTYRKTTAKTVNNSTATTDLLNAEITVGAGVLGSTGVARLTAWGDYLNNTGGAVNSPRFSVAFGGTTQIDMGATADGNIGASANRSGWRAIVEILNTASNVQVINFQLVFTAQAGNGSATTGSFTTGTGVYKTNGGTGSAPQLVAEAYGAGAIDTTAAKALVLNVALSSTSVSHEIKLGGALVEII